MAATFVDDFSNQIVPTSGSCIFRISSPAQTLSNCKPVPT